MSQSRQLAAIMFTDIVGYTALMGNDSAKALELVGLSKEIQKPLVEKYSGQWLKEMGDGALAKFGTALDAVNCAIEIQEFARAKFDGKLRIGIHSGDITIKENDVYGDGVNIASRLQAIADPGGIYISESIEKAIRGQSEVQAKYLGEIKLKNVDYDVRTYAVQGVGLPVPEVKEEKELSGHLWAEIQRRGIIRTIISYIIVSALLVLLWNQVQQWGFELPEWSFTLLITILGLGLPLSLYLAWNYERSPHGFVRTTSEASWQNPLKGRQRKPLTGSIFLTCLVLAGLLLYLFAWNGHQRPSPGQEQISGSTPVDMAIAVLPFKDDSPDGDNQYFADGMMEEILNYLQKIANLGVKSRTAVEPYRNHNPGFKTIAAELGVAYILEGSVRKYGNRFRVTTQLIDVETENHLWSETYDGVFSDTIFIIQTNIAREIAAALDVVITPEEETEINKLPTHSLEAYELFIKGKHELLAYWSTFNHEHLNTAHDFLRRALTYDKEYLAPLFYLGHVFTAEQNYDSALYYAEKIIAVHPQYGDGYFLKAEYYWFTGELDLAIENYLTALESSQFDYKDHELFTPIALGRAFAAKGEVLKALAYMAKALKMHREVLPGTYYNIARAFVGIGDYDRALSYFQLTASKDACLGIFNHADVFLAQNKLQQALEMLDERCNQHCERLCTLIQFRIALLMGEFDKSEFYFSEWLKTDSADIGRYPLSYELGYVYHQQGRIDESNDVFNNEINKLESLDNKNKQQYLSLSRIHAFKGNRSSAIEYLGEYSKRHFSDGWHDFILIDPFFENLRDDPQFKAIIQQAQKEKAELREQVQEMIARGELDL